MLHRNRVRVAMQLCLKCSAQVTVSSQKLNDSNPSCSLRAPRRIELRCVARGLLGTGHAGPAKTLLPAWNDLPVVDIVGDATLECGDHRACGPRHALPELAPFGVRRGVGRE